MDLDIKDLLEILFFLYRWYTEQKKKRSKDKGKPHKQKPKSKKRRK